MKGPSTEWGQARWDQQGIPGTGELAVTTGCHEPQAAGAGKGEGRATGCLAGVLILEGAESTEEMVGEYPSPPSSHPHACCWSLSWMPDGKGALRMDPGHRATEKGGHGPARNTQNDLYGKEQLRPKPPLTLSAH